MDLVVVFLVLCLIAWMRKLGSCRPAGSINSVGPPHRRIRASRPRRRPSGLAVDLECIGRDRLYRPAFAEPRPQFVFARPARA